MDRNGNTILFTYDGSGRLSLITDSLSRNITLAYDINNRITSVSGLHRLTGGVHV